MAIVQISRIQHRRGLQQDLPNLASAELGWSLDEQRLWIGNGTLNEGAPVEGRTEILTNTPRSAELIFSLINLYTFKNLSAGFEVVTGPDTNHPIQRTLQDKLDDVCSVKDFGAMGDGVTDDTAAIQRALDRVYSASQGAFGDYRHRTVNFPAGKYLVTDTIYVPPYTRIQGEGKRSTVINGSFAGPIMRFKDSFGIRYDAFGEIARYGYGADYGSPWPIDSDNSPEIAEYHFNDVSFYHTGETYDQSTVLVDGCFSATFQRCMFRGPLSKTSADEVLNAYDIDRGPGVAAVGLTNLSDYTAVRNVVFIACDFWEHNYGIELDYDVKALSVQACYFDRLYQGMSIGQTSEESIYHPLGVSVYDNYFRYIATEGIKGYANVGQIMSLGNMFTAVGLGDWESPNVSAPVIGYVKTPAITFNNDNNYSIADSFDRDPYYDYPLFPNVETNGYDVYIVGQDRGLVVGDLNVGTGKTIELADAGSFTQANITLIGEDNDTNLVYKDYTNLAMEYTLTHLDQQRTGSLKVSRVGSTYVWDEEYVETGTTGVEFRANTTTGDIEYTSIASGSATSLTYSLKYFS